MRPGPPHHGQTEVAFRFASTACRALQGPSPDEGAGPAGRRQFGKRTQARVVASRLQVSLSDPAPVTVTPNLLM